MPFESLAYRFNFTVEDLPSRWLPLIHLYDPDLPLFPIFYFHAISQDFINGNRPSETQRIYGYVEKINFLGGDMADISIVSNKNLELELNANYRGLAISEVRERIGLNNPVTRADVANGFREPFIYANNVLTELWERVISRAYGNRLPFGKLWDEVFGLARFVASYRSGGRKGELIQTHYFIKKFGERIQSAGEIPQLDYYLVPTYNELSDPDNPLTIFPNFRDLVDIARRFQENYCQDLQVGDLTFPRFINPFPGQLNKNGILNILNSIHIPLNLRPLATEVFNAFNKGPQRTVIFFLTLNNIRTGSLLPDQISNEQLGSLYEELGGSYQSAKVIHIYLQQCHGNESAMPFDIWMETIFMWPLKIYSIEGIDSELSFIFRNSNNLGKVERLLWVAAQARKVHSAACDDAIWCIKKASGDGGRGANPLSCNICLPAIRNVCPAYAEIRDDLIEFNVIEKQDDTRFVITTSSHNNITHNQSFLSCNGLSIYEDIIDDFSPADVPAGFNPFPAANHDGSRITVQEFIDVY